LYFAPDQVKKAKESNSFLNNILRIEVTGNFLGNLEQVRESPTFIST